MGSGFEERIGSSVLDTLNVNTQLEMLRLPGDTGTGSSDRVTEQEPAKEGPVTLQGQKIACRL